jgi:isochorismate synthase
MRDSVQLKDTGLMQYESEPIAFAMIAVASEMNVSYALWKLPKSTHILVLIDFSDLVTKKKAQLEKSEQGFVIQSFLQENNEETIFLNADILYSTANKDISVKAELENPIRKDEFLKKVSEKLKSGNDKISLPVSVKNNSSNKTMEEYTHLVLQAREAIQENRFKKIVLARSKETGISSELSIGSVFQKISTEYPNAFVSLVYTKETGAWLTATPEILASIDKNGIFRTIALAGTQELKPGDSIQKAVWTQKEIEEQALVCRYIIGCFKKIRLREYDENGPRTVQSGNLLHLRTDFAVNTIELNFPELGTVMLELLHPTSAVCGMPKEVTLEFIKEHENLKRKLFSGYLGPVNINSESHIFVNLRCANLFADKVVLYAGAGITQDSEPEKEYRETELKMEAVGRFFVS